MIRVVGDRLQVSRRPGPLVRLGWCRSRPILSLLGGAQVGEVSVSRRRRLGAAAKPPGSARRWQVRVLDPRGRPLSRAFRFRSSHDAELFAEHMRRFAQGTSF